MILQNKGEVELPTYFFQGQKMLSLQSKYILELYFRETVHTLQKILSFFANDVITHLKPIIITSAINMVLKSLFSPKFDDLFIKQFAMAELIIYLFFIIAWNITASFLLKWKYYRIHSFISYLLNVVVVIHMNVFLFMWLLTPGTTIYFKIDILTLLFCIWNILGFAACVILFPVPLLAKQIFIILYCVQISMFVTSMFHENYIWGVLLMQGTWDILHSQFPILKINNMNIKKGLYFSNVHTADSSLFFNSTFSHNISKVNSDKKEVLPKLAQNESSDQRNSSMKTSEKANLHFTESGEIHKPASFPTLSSHVSEALASDGQYDEIISLKKLQERCHYKVKQGINVRIFTLLFYNFLIVSFSSNADFSASYSVLLVISIYFVIKEAAMIFLNKNIPIKLLVLVTSSITFNLIKIIVQPTIDVIIKSFKNPSIFE